MAQRNDNILEIKWNQRILAKDYVDPGIDFSGDPGLTDQSQAKDCDINTIINRFNKSGILPTTNIQATYGDFSDPIEYSQAIQIKINAENQFNQLTAKVRNRFNNNPLEFLQFMADPENTSEAVKLGLATLPTIKQQLDAQEAADGLKTGPAIPTKE